MPNYTIELPDSMHGQPMKKNVDSITFKVTKTCTTCHDDPNTCFPNFMPDGLHTVNGAPLTFGPYTPTADGSVNYNAVTSGTCNAMAGGVAATLCTITVSS